MKREFEEIRKKILLNLNKKPMTKMELSKIIKADYRTVERHLIWLIGTNRIKKVKFSGKTLYKPN
jgi:DNA-binding transcriptional ArsR family regulator